MSTPEQYPLTFNALLNACNQKTSREPVMSLDPDALGRAVQSLVDKGLAERRAVAGTRVPKFTHHVERLLDLARPREIGVLCVLLLRGPQTPGELKTRTERLCAFESTAEVEALLQELCGRPEPWVARLARQPGQKEARYQQLFTGPAPAAEPAAAREAAPERPSAAARPAPDRIAEQVARLEERVAALESRLEAVEGAKSGGPAAA